MTETLLETVDSINELVLAYFVLLNGVYFLTSVIAYRVLRAYARRLKTVHIGALVDAAAAPPITLIATAYNEEATCIDATRALLKLNYHEYEVLFVNDGSKDATLARMIEAFALQPAPRAPTAVVKGRPVRAVYRSTQFPNLWVIDKENGGKADALNVGVSYCRTPLFGALDADGLLERDALMRVVRPFLEDRTTIASGGIIRIINGCTVEDGAVTGVMLSPNLLARLQVLEYLRAFLAGRVGWNNLNATLIISGAFGVFRRDIVVAAGGYSVGSLGEDIELVLRLHRYCTDHGIPYRIEYVPDPVAWTQCPEDLKSLGGQRVRWQRGLAESLMKHRGMMLRPRYGGVAMLSMPFSFFLEMLGPAIEALGYLGFAVALAMGRVSALYALAFFLVAFVLGAVLSMAAIALEERLFHRYRRTRDLAHLLAMSLTEVLWYRQINSFWRVKGLWAAIRGGKEGWGTIKRQGFQAGAT